MVLTVEEKEERQPSEERVDQGHDGVRSRVGWMEGRSQGELEKELTANDHPNLGQTIRPPSTTLQVRQSPLSLSYPLRDRLS